MASGLLVLLTVALSSLVHRSYTETSISPLVFTIEPQTRDVLAGDTAEFTCQATGNPDPSVNWYYKGKIIPFNDNRKQTVRRSYSYQILKIVDVRHEEDSGLYYCKAENIDGAIQSRSANLRIPFLKKDGNYFTLQPAPVYLVQNGEGVVIPCRYAEDASYPNVNIFWRKLIDETRFVNIQETESRRISRYGSMIITQTRPEDSGVYSCIARNKLEGSVSQSGKTKLSVTGTQTESVAQVYVGESYVEVLRGEVAELECIPYGFPPPYIVWTKESGDLPTKAIVSSDTTLLRIPAFSAEDTGRYFCAAVQNGERIRQVPLSLSMLEPPSFPVSFKNLTIELNADLLIPCGCTGVPKPDVTWMKDSYVINTNVKEDNSLQLYDAKQTTKGMYQCHCQNKVGYAQTTFAVIVISAAKVTTEGYSRTVRRNEEVTLTCDAQGAPWPSIVWKKDGKILPTEARIQHFHKVYEGTVRIKNLTTSDNGVYECNALNEYGEDSIFVTLKVEGEPFINVEPKNTVGITGTDVMVRCEATASPDPIVSWQRNEMDIKPGQSPKYEAITGQGLLIKNAQAVDGGSFLCQAQNSLGLRSSQPVQVTIYNVPKITHSLPPTTNVTAGKTDLLLQCGITRDFADYQWYRRGVPVMREYYKDNQAQVRIDIRKGVGLYFYSVLPEDQGEYTCNVSNPAAAASVSGKLFVDVMPTISYISPNVEVREYDNFWLDCVYDGTPTPSIRWLHNDEPITRDHKIFPNGTLSITYATRFDKGAFFCVVSNRQGERKKSVIVKVRSKARIERIPSPQHPITAQSSTIYCEVSGYPFPVVEWKKDGVKIESINAYGFVKSTTNLRIEKPDRTIHDGLYSCRASNDFGSDEKMTRVKVLDPPVISRVNSCGPVKEGLSCKISCEASGNPLPTLTWQINTKEGSKIISSDNRKYFVQLRDNDQQKRVIDLTIKDLTAEDSRLYYCHAENDAGADVRSDMLNVRYGPIFVSPPMINYEVPMGATLTISCRVQGEPKPEVKWGRDNGVLPANGRSRIDENGSLVIMNVMQPDEGSYTCVADNNQPNTGFEFATISKSTYVKISAKDSPSAVIDNPIETWLIIVICICVFVLCIVIFVSVKMIRDKSREKRSYKPTALGAGGGGGGAGGKGPEEPSYQYQTVPPKTHMFSVPVDTTNSLPMYNLRTLTGGRNNHHPPPQNSFQTQCDDVDRQLDGLLKDLDYGQFESDI